MPRDRTHPAKSLAPPARDQRRSHRRRVRPQDPAAALRPLHPPPRRLPFRLHQARADRGDRRAVHGQGAGLAGVRARRRDVAGDAGAVRKTVSEDVRLHREDAAAVRLHRGLAVLPEKLHAHARPFRHLWLCAGDHPAADAGGLIAVRGDGRAVLDHPRADPPHSSLDVCADDHHHRRDQALSRLRPQSQQSRIRHRRPRRGLRAVLRRAVPRERCRSPKRISSPI